MKIFELSTTDYLEDKRLINNALSDMASQFGLPNDFAFGEPTSRFGWTFCKLWIKPNLLDAMSQKFDDMIRRYKGKPDEKLTFFIADYFQSKGCKSKVKMIDA